MVAPSGSREEPSLGAELLGRARGGSGRFGNVGLEASISNCGVVWRREEVVHFDSEDVARGYPVCKRKGKQHCDGRSTSLCPLKETCHGMIEHRHRFTPRREPAKQRYRTHVLGIFSQFGKFVDPVAEEDDVDYPDAPIVPFQLYTLRLVVFSEFVEEEVAQCPESCQGDDCDVGCEQERILSKCGGIWF